MVYQNVSTNEASALCRNLSAKYSGRFNAAVKNAADIEMRRKNASRMKNNLKKKSPRDNTNVKKIVPGYASAKRAAREPSFEGGAFIADGGRFTYAYKRGSALRRMSADFDSELYERYLPGTAVKREKGHPGKNKSVKKNKEGKKRDSIFREDKSSEKREKRVRTAPLPKSFVAALVLCTVLLMVVLYTYSSYSQISSEVYDLKTEQSSLLVERDRLKGRLEIRDDIRVIENRAVNDIGMVQSDFVETRYVSVAGGERIEVISADNENGEKANFFSTILSGMGGQFERILDYID